MNIVDVNNNNNKDNINKDNGSIYNKIFFKKFQVSKILSPKVPRKHLYIPTIWQNVFFIPKLFLKMPFTEILRINHVEYLFLEVKLKKKP